MHLLPPYILLSADDDPVGFILQIGGAVLGLIAVVVVGWFAIVRIRAWMHTSEDTSAPFTLDDLRRLHREGKLTEAEFQRAREAMIGAVRSQKTGESSRAGASTLDPALARLIAAESDQKPRNARQVEPRRPSGSAPVKPASESIHGETVVRRPDQLRRHGGGDPEKRAE
jgi:hypothetical protein